jgi:putative transposase
MLIWGPAPLCLARCSSTLVNEGSYTTKNQTMDEQTNINSQDDLINLLLNNGITDGMKPVMELLLNAAMLIERTTHLNAQPHERSPDRNGYANGFKPRSYQSSIGKLELQYPQVRDSESTFTTSLFEKGSRSERALKAAIATMYIQGVSTRKVTKVMEDLCGFEVSSGQVSSLSAQLDEEFTNWRERELPDIKHMICDASYYKVRHNGVVRDCAVLIAIGVRAEDGKRMILGVSCKLSEAEIHWRDFFTTLKERGLGIPDSITSDAHEGLKAALRTAFSSTPWQRCQFHLQQNAQAYVPKVEMKQQVALDIRRIFNSPDRAHAELELENLVNKYQKNAPELARWMEQSIPEGLTIFSLPAKVRTRLRTSNMCETLNGNIKRRTKVVGVFPNAESLLRLVTGVIIEISDEWEIGKTYLNVNTK